MKKKFSARTAAALLSVLLVFSCVLSRPAALNARAASLAGALALDEASMLLWNLLFTLFVGAGAVDSLERGSYEMEAALYAGMVDYYMEAYGAAAVSDDMVFTLSDGSRYTLGDLITAARWDIMGADGCYIPDEAAWQRLKLSAPADEAAFSSIAGFSISAGLLDHMAGFAGAVQAGKVEGLDPAAYFPAGFDGTLPRDAEGRYIVQGYTLCIWGSSLSDERYVIDYLASLYPAVAYINTDKVVERVGFLYLDSDGTVKPQSVYHTSDTGVRFYQDCVPLGYGYYSLSVPVFSSRAAAELFLNTGDFAAVDCENVLLWDYPALADAIPDTFAPLLAKELAPSILLDLYPALADALNPALNPDIPDVKNPALVLDPVAATDAYQKAVAGAVADVADAAVPVPADPDMGSYKVNLTNIFPFCLPFDFIRLLDALDAEPVTPVFEFPFVVPALDIDITVTLDMSFLEPAMEVFRMGETVGFVILLIVLTQRVIKW